MPGEDRVSVTGGHLPGTLRQHGKLLQIAEELLISGEVLKVVCEIKKESLTTGRLCTVRVDWWGYSTVSEGETIQ